MMIFVLEPKYASMIDTASGIEHAADRGVFMDAFPEMPTPDVEQLSYEPSKQIFHVIKKDGALIVAQDPLENESIAWVHEHIESLRVWFSDQMKLASPPSDLHVFDFDSHQWTITPQNEAVLLQRSIVKGTQDRLDAFARTRNYDGILSACTYATSSVPSFAAEGQYCVEARDATWAKLYEILLEVESGFRPAPESYSDVEGDLPELAWPQ